MRMRCLDTGWWDTMERDCIGVTHCWLHVDVRVTVVTWARWQWMNCTMRRVLISNIIGHFHKCHFFFFHFKCRKIILNTGNDEKSIFSNCIREYEVAYTCPHTGPIAYITISAGQATSVCVYPLWFGIQDILNNVRRGVANNLKDPSRIFARLINESCCR